MMVIHDIDPIYNKDSRVLILGTMPSPLSRKGRFFYAHPQNRFWRVLSELYGVDLADASNDEKRSFALQNRIALWDVLKSCDIEGASDQSIKNPAPNDISIILDTANIKSIFTTGRKAYSLYRKLILPTTGIEPHLLPSTSPANCAFSLSNLASSYLVIKEAAREE